MSGGGFYAGERMRLVNIGDGPLADVHALSNERCAEIAGSLTGEAVYCSVLGESAEPFNVTVTVGMVPGASEERYERIKRLVADAVRTIAEGVEASGVPG